MSQYEASSVGDPEGAHVNEAFAADMSVWKPTGMSSSGPGEALTTPECAQRCRGLISK